MRCEGSGTGSVEVVIHDAKIVQVIRTEKVRFDNNR